MLRNKPVRRLSVIMAIALLGSLSLGLVAVAQGNVQEVPPEDAVWIEEVDENAAGENGYFEPEPGDVKVESLEPGAAPTLAREAVIWTDKDDYAPDEWVTIYGVGFEVCQPVTVTVTTPDGVVHTFEAVVTDWEGSLEFCYPPPLMEGLYHVTVTDGVNTAGTTFTDSPKVGSVTVGEQSPDPVAAGGSAEYKVTVVAGNNAKFTVTLSITAELPTGVSASFTPPSLDFNNEGGRSKTSTLTLTTAATTPVGLHSFTVQAGEGKNDYAEATGVLKVEGKAAATVTLSNLLQTYDGTPKSATVTTNPSGLNVTVTYGGEPDAPTDAGTYAVVATVDDPNYEGSAEGTLTISKKTINATAEAKSKTYGDADPALTYTYSPALVDHDTFSGELARNSGENVGEYAITQGTLALSDNYELVFTGAKLTISKKTINVTAEAKSKTYGDADPALTYTYSPALVGDDTFSGELVRDSGENVGDYAITQGTLALSSNYELVFTGAKLTISKKTINVTAEAKSKTYGDADPALTYQITSGSLAFGDEFTGALTREAGENVGEYAITQGTLALSSNYVLDFVGAKLTIHYGFGGLQSPYEEPPRSFKINSSIPLKWYYTDYASNVVNSSLAAPDVRIVRVGSGESGNDEPILVQAKGQSGLRYHAGNDTWQFNWETKGLQPGLYHIFIYCAQSGVSDGPMKILLR